MYCAVHLQIMVPLGTFPVSNYFFTVSRLQALFLGVHVESWEISASLNSSHTRPIMKTIMSSLVAFIWLSIDTWQIYRFAFGNYFTFLRPSLIDCFALDKGEKPMASHPFVNLVKICCTTYFLRSFSCRFIAYLIVWKSLNLFLFCDTLNLIFVNTATVCLSRITNP